MNVRYTMQSVGENAFKDKGCSNSNDLSFRSEYNISKPPICGDISCKSDIDCSYCRTRERRSTTAAGLKLFTIVILHSWRKRKDEIKKLLQTVEKLKQESIRTQNQLHIYNSLIKVEQKRNQDLSSQLSRTLTNLKKATATVISLKADKAILEHQLKDKYEEYDALHAVLAQTRTDLFHSMMEQRNLQSQLCKEQRMVQSLENQKTELLNKISDINMEHSRFEEPLSKDRIKQESHLYEHRIELAEHDRSFANYKEISTCGIIQKSDELNNKEVKLLCLQVAALQNNLKNQRLRSYWKQLWEYKNYAFRYIHVLIYYLLPATPTPPKFRCESQGS